MSDLNYVHLLGCVGVFITSKLLESGVNKSLSMMINFKYRMDVSSTKASQISSIVILYVCMFNIRQLNSMFQGANIKKFMCLCIFLLNEELNILIFTS
jgi:hypothetical protein